MINKKLLIPLFFVSLLLTILIMPAKADTTINLTLRGSTNQNPKVIYVKPNGQTNPIPIIAHASSNVQTYMSNTFTFTIRFYNYTTLDLITSTSFTYKPSDTGHPFAGIGFAWYDHTPQNNFLQYAELIVAIVGFYRDGSYNGFYNIRVTNWRFDFSNLANVTYTLIATDNTIYSLGGVNPDTGQTFYMLFSNNLMGIGINPAVSITFNCFNTKRAVYFAMLKGTEFVKEIRYYSTDAHLQAWFFYGYVNSLNEIVYTVITNQTLAWVWKYSIPYATLSYVSCTYQNGIFTERAYTIDRFTFPLTYPKNIAPYGEYIQAQYPLIHNGIPKILMFMTKANVQTITLTTIYTLSGFAYPCDLSEADYYYWYDVGTSKFFAVYWDNEWKTITFTIQFIPDTSTYVLDKKTVIKINPSLNQLTLIILSEELEPIWQPPSIPEEIQPETAIPQIHTMIIPLMFLFIPALTCAYYVGKEGFIVGLVMGAICLFFAGYFPVWIIFILGLGIILLLIASGRRGVGE